MGSLNSQCEQHEKQFTQTHMDWFYTNWFSVFICS